MTGPRMLRDTAGAVLVEFALVAPVLLLMLLATFEVGHGLYTQAQLQGAVQAAARSSTLEGAAGHAGTIDERVAQAVAEIRPEATIDFGRRSYASFSRVGQAEDFVDVNGDGLCNDGEQFEDANGNGVWDEDRGRTGFGGARDVVVYTVTITYPRTFGMAQMFGFTREVTVVATTVLRNQPYDEQDLSSVTGNCA